MTFPPVADVPRASRSGPAGHGGEPLLAVRGLSVAFPSRRGPVPAVADVTFEIWAGERVAIVGESGSGKSVACLSVLRLVDGAQTRGQALLRLRDGTVLDLNHTTEPMLRRIRGDEIAMVFQEPMTSLNPIYTVGDQIAEAVRYHQGKSWTQGRHVAVDLLRQVGIADPERRALQYPHEHSGGMRQRVMIAMALACRPALLIADEATSALDVTIQAQILDLLRDLGSSAGGMAMIIVTHDMGVVGEIADRVLVMYAGRVVEEGPVRRVLDRPLHPYTRGLIASSRPAPRNGRRRSLPIPIPGSVPSGLDRPSGCAFHPRCSFSVPACAEQEPRLEAVEGQGAVRCLRWQEIPQ